MSNQYFDNNPNLVSKPFKFNFYFKQKHLTFNSDNGVFSKSGVDFGSSLLLKNVVLDNHQKVLDVGCGIGIIGITLAKMSEDIFVDMIDVNLKAIELTKKNFIENNVSNAKVFESNIYQNVTDSYDLIVTNPPIRAGKQVVHEIILKAFDHLADGGNLYIVIQKKQGAESALKVLNEVYHLVEVITKDDGYYIIKCTK